MRRRDAQEIAVGGVWDGVRVVTKAGGNRRFAGATAPAAGLYLWRVEYPPSFGIPLPQPGLIGLN